MARKGSCHLQPRC